MNRETENLALESGIRLSHPEEGDEVVITGMAGRFPDSDNVYELRDNLMNKVDLISGDDRRWCIDHPEIPQRTGKINNVTKFDASFFGVHFKQAHTMDPMCRILLESAYEAVVDAGVNPRQLRGSRTGVFIGACFSESEKTWFYEKIQVNGFGITGCSRAMLANRVSYWLGANGPSYTVDSACSSSLYALDHAYKAIRDGHCDAALVGGSNLCLHPYVSLQFARLGVLSSDGRCKSFDNSADGYARSEAVCMIFLQKAKNAKRIYGRVVHTKTNCDGYKEQGITYPSGSLQRRLLKEFYDECQIPPQNLAFVEAHGTGTKVGDPEELNALVETFCNGRDKPLPVGSVKSNLGHSEPASGLCSITKVCLAFETGIIPPNLHFNTPREGVEALVNGQIQVVSEKAPLEGDLIGVNSFGFGGANCHVLVQGHNKEKINNGKPTDGIPRLVVTSGRTEEAVNSILDDLEKRSLDQEFIRLIHEVHQDEIPGHVYRGYSVLSQEDSEVATRISREAQYFSGAKRPIWFVFSGMGSQWAGMGTQLMKIPIFAAAIERCHQALAPKGINITDVITNPDKKTFDNILNSFVGIAAIQIGLVDILHAIGIVPDNIIGHSVGELGCAYADGCFTAEQMILSAYSRGLASIETKLIKGSMAAVGMGYKEIKELCPPEIEVACHNGPDSSTISGPAEKMSQFVAELQAKDIFAREVPCSNIAYHSRYIAEAGPTLLKYLRQVITDPIKRSSKWISSSVPQEMWSSEAAQYSSAEYHTNNLLNSVLFEEASKHIPASAITIEIAPHGLLQAILRRSLKSDVTNVALTQRGHKDNTEVLLSGLGKLFQAGLNLNLAKLYPDVEFPVSRGTPMLSPLVKWEHTEDWFVTSYRMQEKIKSGERTVTVNLADEELNYLSGHVIDGRNLYPATAYLTLVWETIGMMRGEIFTNLSIVFENVRFLRATHIPKEGNLEFTVMVQKGTGNFEVIESGAAVVTGRAFVPTDVTKEQIELEKPERDNEMLSLTSKDIYKELRLRGYNYSGSFRGLVSCDNAVTTGEILWETNWVSFLDNMLQMKILKEDTRSLYVPTEIQRLSIDCKTHAATILELGEEKSIPVYTYDDVGILKSGGVEIRGMKASVISRKKPLGEPVLEKYKFVSHSSNDERRTEDAIRINVQLALENVPGYKLKVVEVINNASTEPLSKDIALAFGDLPLVQAEISILIPSDVDIPDPGLGITVENRKLQTESNCYFVVAQDLLKNSEILEQALKVLKPNGFILSRENLSTNINVPANLQILTSQVVNNERLVLLKKKPDLKKIKLIHVREDDVQLRWLKEVQKSMKMDNRIVLCSQSYPKSGILGLVNCLRKEPGGEVFQCVFILDKKAPKFNIEDKFYKSQLDLNLAFNVLQNGQWGTFRHLLLPRDSFVVSEHAYVNALTRGDLSSLKWIQGSLNNSSKPGPDQELVEVNCSSLNFRDIMLTTNKLAAEVVETERLKQDLVIGFEFAGVTKSSGRRVMGFCGKGAISTIALADKNILWDVPDTWSLRDAATIPVAYGTAYYALVMIGEMRKGMSVLIHAGSGGVGQAAINIALFYGCTVYTTVGTEEKRNFIKKSFPQIKDSQIGNSRDASFEQLVLNATDGRGVDLVLNSLAEEKLQASVRCLACNGRFLEIGKFDLASNNQLGMGTFLKETSFHGVMLDNFIKAPNSVKKQLHELMKEGILSGCVRPLPSTVFQHDEVEQAFRYMAAGKHIGKVMIEVKPEEMKTKPIIPAIPRFYCQPNSSYVICGGLGGFGLELADWLVLRGARKLVLTSRKGLTTGYQGLRLKIWRQYGCIVKISTLDCSTQKGCDQLLQEARTLGPVAAIFNLAVHLSDALFENQTENQFTESFAPKAIATTYLDVASRKLCPELQHFVVFSSVSCGRGNAGQTNYGMSNSVMERICEARVADGLPGLAVQWGAIGEVGLVADMQESDIDIEIGGTLQQRVGSCLEALDGFLIQKEPVVASMVVAEKRVGSGSKDGMVETVANLLGIRDLKTISLQTTLAELGMDSMMAVEIKQGLEREFEIFLTSQEVRGLTFERLHELAELHDSALASEDRNNSNELNAEAVHFLIRVVGDELKASQAILRLPSLADDGKLIEDASPAVFLIPGIEGIASVVEPLAAKLKMQALCLQLGYDQPATSVEEMAKQLTPHIKSRLTSSGGYNIVAYSFGALIALEISRILEKQGRRGKLCLIDGAPDFQKAIINFQMNVSDEHSLQVDLLCTVIGLLGLTDKGDFKEGIEVLPDWSEKLKLFLAYTPPNSQFSKEYQKAICNATYARVKATLAYDTNNFQPIQSPITLIRPTEVSVSNMQDDYGLSQLTKGGVNVQYVEGNHATILENKKSATIINTLCFEGEDPTEFKSNIMGAHGMPVNENISNTKRL